MTASSATNRAAPARLPVFGLLALATASFVSILTEALPAGLLPQMAHDLGVSEAAAGQFVTIYAIASLIVAIPVTAMTQGLRRKPLLMAAIGGFAAGNIVTSISNDYALTLAARFCAGAGAGLLWALLPGYASRMAPAESTRAGDRHRDGGRVGRDVDWRSRPEPLSARRSGGTPHSGSSAHSRSAHRMDNFRSAGFSGAAAGQAHVGASGASRFPACARC